MHTFRNAASAVLSVVQSLALPALALAVVLACGEASAQTTPTEAVTNAFDAALVTLDETAASVVTRMVSGGVNIYTFVVVGMVVFGLFAFLGRFVGGKKALR